MTGSRQTELQVPCEGLLCSLVCTNRESSTLAGDYQDSGFVAMQFPMSYVWKTDVRRVPVRCAHTHTHTHTATGSFLGGPLQPAHTSTHQELVRSKVCHQAQTGTKTNRNTVHLSIESPGTPRSVTSQLSLPMVSQQAWPKGGYTWSQ